MKTKRSKSTRLQCPECRMELLPGDYSMESEHMTCCRCGREIFVNLCEEESECCKPTTENREMRLVECCC